MLVEIGKLFLVIVACIVILSVLYLLAIMPRMFARPDTTLFQKRLFAHRGLHDNSSQAPENSMAAFRKAVEAGYGMELDVHVTKDKVPVIYHDFELDRVCGQPGKIEDYTYEELQQFTLFDTQERIPTLEELLRMVDGKVPLIVEIKSESVNVSVCRIIDQMLRQYQGA